jgi:3-oxoacyl-ACP reductase-like protein
VSNPLIPAWIQAQIDAALAAAEAARLAALAANPASTTTAIAAAAAQAALDENADEISTLREQHAAYFAEALRLRAENAELTTKLNEAVTPWAPAEDYPPIAE